MPNPDGSKTQEELNEEASLNEEALRRQDPSETQRMQDMEALEAQRTRRLIADLRANGLEEDARALEATLNNPDEPAANTPTPPPPPPPPREEETEHRGAATPPPPAAPTPPPAKTPAAPAAPAAPAVDPQLLAQLGQGAIPLEALDALKVRMRIAGEDVEMTVHDLRRSAQLDGAAHKRLEEANRLLNEARQAAERTRSGAPAAPTPPQPPVGVDQQRQGGDHSPASVTEKVNSLVNALFVGDAEAAAAALQEVLTTGRQAVTVEPDQQLVATVAGHVKQQLSVEEANEQFRSNFPEIVGDRTLASAADQFYAEALAENPKMGYSQALEEAGKRTRAWMASKGMSATGPQGGSTRQERQDRKERAADREVRSANRTTQGQQEERIPSPSETIEEMRKARGLA